MGNNVYTFLGKSACGKDTLYKNVKKFLINEGIWDLYNFKDAVMYTTRPMRDGEVNGREYHFVDEAFLENARKNGEVLEERSYDTKYGIWYYFTHVNTLDVTNNNYFYIQTPAGYKAVYKSLGDEHMNDYYIWVPDDVLLTRAINREKTQEIPKYEEMCRRFLADSKDFSEENLNELENIERIYNGSLDVATNQIVSDIKRRILK